MDTCRYRLECEIPYLQQRCDHSNYTHCFIYHRRKAIEKKDDTKLDEIFEQIEQELFIGSKI